MDINFSLIWDALPLLLAGAGITIEITALSVGFGLLIGMTVGIARLASIKPVAGNYWAPRGSLFCSNFCLFYQ